MMNEMHDASRSIIILGGDPGSVTGLVSVLFYDRRRDGSPLWSNAKLLATAIVKRQSALAGKTIAELDVKFRTSLQYELTAMHHIAPAVAAFEEPGDGGEKYRKKPGEGQNEASRERVGTQFRLGVAYASLVHATSLVMPLTRIVSFPTQSTKGRRGWMKAFTKREVTMNAAIAILKSISTPEQYAAILGKKSQPADHLLMAVGVINHVCEYWPEYFPPKQYPLSELAKAT